MGRVAISSDVWTDVRFAKLQDAMGWSRAKTLGVLTILWANTRIVGTDSWSAGRLADCLVCPDPPKRVINQLITARYLEHSREGLVVVDNTDWHRVANRLKANASKGGLARSAATKSRKARKQEAIDGAFDKAKARQDRRLQALKKQQICP